MRILICFITSVFLFYNCSSCKDEKTPEELIKEQVKQIIDFANKRQIKRIMDYISPDYKDSYGNRRESIKGILIQNLMFRKNVKVMINDTVVKLTEGGATVYLGLFVKEGEGVLPDNADIIRIELNLIKTKDKWLIISARWKSGVSPF